MKLTKNMMVYLQHLSESPNLQYDSPPRDEDLNDRGMNTEFAKQAKEGVSVGNIVYLNHDKEIKYFDESYYIMGTDNHYILARMSGQQLTAGFRFIDVWNSISSSGIAREAIFQYFLKHFAYVQSDWSHTIKGMKYWQKILEQALNEGYKCTICKYDNTEIPLTDKEAANDYWSFNTECGNYAFRIYRK